MTHQVSGLIACMNSHFACDDQSPVDCETWRHLRRHIVRMNTALHLVRVTLREEREPGIPLHGKDRAQARGVGTLGRGSLAPRSGSKIPAAGPDKSSCKNVGSPHRGLRDGMRRWTNGLPGATARLGAMMALRGLSASQCRMRADTHPGPEHQCSTLEA